MLDSGVTKIAFYTDGNNNYINAGKVGIGTSTPDYKLDVETTSDIGAGVYIQAGKSSQGEIQNTALIIGSKNRRSKWFYI